MIMLTFGAPVMRLVARGAALIPPLPLLPDLLADWFRQDPEPSAAVVQGLFFNRTAPHKTLRKTFETPTLILGHQRDPVHPFSDADCLAAELPNARLIEAGSFFEMRFSPDRLTSEIADFLDTCWKPKRATGAGAPGARARAKKSA